MEFDRKDINMNKLVATSLEGKFHVFDMRTQHLTKGFASVSEKVINLPDGCLAPACGEKTLKGYYPYYFVWRGGEMGAHVALTIFTAGSDLACVCLTFSVAERHWPTMTPGRRGGENCGFLWRKMLEKHT